jgi:hypothetical protein
MGGSALMQGAGAQQASAATVEGAQTAADISDMNIAFQREMFDTLQAQQAPYIEAGAQAAPMVGQAVRGELDYTSLPAYQQQAGTLQDLMGERFGGSLSGGTMDRAMTSLGAREEGAAKTRLFDLMKAGYGQAETAGALGRQESGAVSRAMMGAGNLMAAANMMQANTQQSLGAYGADVASGLPAYFASQRPAQANQPTWYQGGAAPSGSAGFGPGL